MGCLCKYASEYAVIVIKKGKKRRWWTHPMLLRRKSHGHFHVNYEECRHHPDWFEDEYLMPIPVYDELLSLLSRNLSKQDTNMRKSIGPCERLAVTLQ
ncbi:unnamed protein product [Parnassius apollo]|uniref:(apollo) hypothetical protein n=1 Tax=Parnassius apollo TaxID=110799 RepID=A0A8S3WXR9_PARAO|nr:unnamed protein product [Parnassius apollo]